jgi:N-acyl-L-homoserine lactone synthetase
LIDGGAPIKPDRDLGEATQAELANPKGNDEVARSPVITSTPRLAELELPIYDHAAFQEIADCVSPTNIATYIEAVIEQSERLLDRLRAPVPLAADRGDLALSAHVLGGRAGMFGFQRLALGAHRYEQAIGTDAPETPALVADLIAVIEASLSEMRSLVLQVARAVPARDRTKTGTPSLADAIAAVRREFVIEVANTAELILDAQRLRYQVYCVERCFESSGTGVEHDKFDVRSRHIVLRRRDNGEVVGTTRVVLYNPDAPGDSFPMQGILDASLLHGLPIVTTAEVSRFAISKHLRGASPALMRLALIQGVFRVGHELGLTDCWAVMERTLLRLLKSSAIHFRVLGPLVEYHGMRQPCCANIVDTVARMQVEQPEIWAFVSDNGRSFGKNPVVSANPVPQKKTAGDWLHIVADRVRYACNPNFEQAGLAVLDANAPPQHYRHLHAVRPSSPGESV